MTRTVEYCRNNVTAATRDRLANITTETVIEKRCLQRCGECYRGCFLVIDGELKTAASHDDILTGLKVTEE